MAAITIKTQNYGIEIEMTGITRRNAAKALGNLWGTTPLHTGGSYDKWTVNDSDGKEWTLVYDGSIAKEEKMLNSYVCTSNVEYSVEMVSPILTYEEQPKLQEAIRTVRRAGAKVNDSCGIHIHIDGENHTAKSVKNILSIMYSKEDLLFKALQVKENRVSYCNKVRGAVLEIIRKQKKLSWDKLAEIWYHDKHWERQATQHYNHTRYHAVNLHALFNKGTIEFRLFNSTLHAGEVKAYINLALAISAQAIRQKSSQMHKTESTNEKFTFRTWLLRLGLNGDEFKTTRNHLLKHLDGDIAWRYEPEHYPTHPHNIVAAIA